MSEKYWLDKMNENPRYREIWEKIKELPFHETTEIILDLEAKLAEKDATIEYLKDEKDGIEQANECLNKMFIEVKEEIAEKEKEIEIEKKVSDWLYDIHNRTGYEQEVSEKCKTATEIKAQFQLYEYCKNQFINNLRSEVKKKLKD